MNATQTANDEYERSIGSESRGITDQFQEREPEPDSSFDKVMSALWYFFAGSIFVVVCLVAGLYFGGRV